MQKFLLGILAGLILAFLAGVVFVFSLARLGDRKPSVPGDSALMLRLEGSVPESSPMEYPLPFLEQQTPTTVYETWHMLRKAAKDSRVKALVIAPRGMSTGWATLEEIRDSVLEFKKSGKPVFAYLSGARTGDYYIASAADRIYMAPEDMLDVKGLKLETMYLKGALDKLGVQMEIEAVGKYKDGGDMFTRTAMTPETRQVLNEILDQLYGNLTSTIAQGRKKSQDEVKAILDKGPFVGDEAKTNGLVDVLGFEDQLLGDLEKQVKISKLNRLAHVDYRKTFEGDEMLGKNKVALVVGEGEIVRGGGAQQFGDDGLMASTRMVKMLKQVADDSSIKGVILRVDSPGGDGIASDDILHQVKELSKKKPLVISMSDLAASGGYFIAMTGDPVVAYPNTITGSIGVFYGRPNLRGLYDKIGINKEILTRGKYAAMDTDYRPLSDDERQKLRADLQKFYRGFVERVASGRKRKYEEVEPLAQGRVWMGVQAKANGLVDELGGLDRAIQLLKDRAKIGANDEVTLVPYPRKRSLWEYVMTRSDQASLSEVKILKKLLGDAPVENWTQGGMMRLMPYQITVK
jgi:protease-4